MSSKRRVRDLKRSDKTFPQCREYIDREGLAPHILADSIASYWNRVSATNKAGEIVDCLSTSQQKQMTNMILDGCYGEELKDAFLDDMSYWRVRDNLITWPDQERILKENLRAIEVTRVA